MVVTSAPAGPHARVLDRRALHAARHRVLSTGRNWTKAEVYALTLAGREIVVKDYRRRPWIVRQTLGRWLIGREARNYSVLSGVDGVAPLVGRPDAFSLALESIDGTRLERTPRGAAGAGIFEHLDRILREIHRRGVALADLHHRNVLVRDGRPYLVDLAMAVQRRGGLHLLGPVLFATFRRLDRVALLRMKRRFTGTLTADEERELSRNRWVHVAGRVLKALLDLRPRRRRGARR